MSSIPAVVILSDAQIAELTAIVSKAKVERRLFERASIVLALGRGLGPSECARVLGLTLNTVRKWRDRWLEKGLDGLRDSPRPGQPRKMSPEREAEIVQATQFEPPPKGRSHWSRTTMAKRFNTNASRIGQIWKAHGLKPHLSHTFKISRDPKLVEKVRDICGLYLNPPDNALVLCVDEKTQIQALDRTQPLLPLRPGQAERRTWDYARNGTANLYAALEIATGHVHARITRRQRAVEFLGFLRQIDAATPAGLNLHLILDNSSTHKTATVRAWLQAHPRFHVHFTPTSGSWLNLVETWFSALTRRRLKRGVFRSQPELTKALREYVATYNADPRPFRWTKSADAILKHSHMRTN
jgi:transposase